LRFIFKQGLVNGGYDEENYHAGMVSVLMLASMGGCLVVWDDGRYDRDGRHDRHDRDGDNDWDQRHEERH
jgi:hypothetical protein